MAPEEPQFSDFPVGTIACVKGQTVSLCVRSHKEVKERKLVLCTWFDKQGLMHNDALPIEMLEERKMVEFPQEYFQHLLYRPSKGSEVIPLKEHD